MRLAPFAPDPPPNPVAGHATLEAVLGLNAIRVPERIATVDAGLSFPGTWREIDRAVSALAHIFASWRLEPDSVVGVQLGSSVEAALTCLALWRADLIPAMLPLAWRRAEIARALATVDAAAVVAVTEGGGAPLAAIACEVAVGLGSIRFVGCFGDRAPDGATPLDAVLAEPAEPSEPRLQPQDAADHVAVVTFEAGGVPVPRSHNDLVAAGLAPLLASGLAENCSLLSTLDLAGLAGLATGLAPWLTTGCKATFHQATTTEAIAAAARRLGATHVVLPGRAVDRLVADGALAGLDVAAATAVWRAPDGRGVARPLELPGAKVVDALLIGELGLIAAARSNDGRHPPVPLGCVGPTGLDALIELRMLPDGRLFVRGPACPQAAFQVVAGAPSLSFGADGYLDTGLAGIADRIAGRATLGGRRRGVIQVGGVAVSEGDVETIGWAAGVTGSLRPEDDALFGSRFVLELGSDDPDVPAEHARAALAAAGLCPAMAPTAVLAGRARRTA